ncbi:hypothetical protein GCM10011509_16020 [Ornithinimicrobium pekingense]|uniref:DUF1918 domain-containing protein n=1 Tax=Ornithinimicrobium pekingense TaxID=384677 RepID=A0ABQ2FA32_9MICO|nr:hypothetical protein GCM10011509_16020 [Ornithinimicrobium pekingense]
MLAAAHVGEPTRDGRVLETRGAEGGPPYLVEWSDGHTGLIFPGPGAVLRVSSEDEPQEVAEAVAAAPAGSSAAPAAAAHGASGQGSGMPHVREWSVRVSIFENADDTDVRAVLLADAPEHLVATGQSHRSPKDRPVPEIGDEVAVARALRHLADNLLATAERDIEEMTGKDAQVRPT